jgi:hypothetical protein
MTFLLCTAIRHCNLVKSLSFARIPTPMMAEFLTQSRKDAKAQRVFSFLASLHCKPSESRIPAKIFSRRGAEPQRKPGRAFLLGLSLRLRALRETFPRHGFGCGGPRCDIRGSVLLIAAGRVAFFCG